MQADNYLIVCLLGLLILNLPSAATSEGQFSMQVGARGDDAARGNLGVRAEVLTHVYNVTDMTLDYFWIGTILENGAFVQFGYALEPGQYCLKGMFVSGEFQCVGVSGILSNLEARWQWQYWPNLYTKDFYYEIGPAESAGLNGTWHLYSIVPSSTGRVSFTLDGVNVAAVDFQLTLSEEPPMIVAEKAGSQEPSNLGSVEFRNMAYLKDDGWHLVDSLVSLIGCGINTMCTRNNPYGVSVIGPNHIAAGSGIPVRKSGELLWTSSYVTLNVMVHPQVEFHIMSIIGDRMYTGNASVSVPKGLYVHVALVSKTSRADSFLGVLGANDEFQGWVGDINSANQSVLLLMNRDKALTATWRMGFSSLILSLMLPIALVAVAVGLLIYRRVTKPRPKV